MIIDGREIGPGHPPYVVAEISCNHGGSLDRALQLINAAKDVGADAVKLQAYEADTITIDMDFKLPNGPWQGQRLYDLYKKTQTPLSWFPLLARRAREARITWFASVFDRSSVDALETLGCPAYKIASMEIVDLPLIRYAASKGKPMIISTGMASEQEVGAAISAVPSKNGLAILHCVSAYPTHPSHANLGKLREIAGRHQYYHIDGHDFSVGISDHTAGIEVPIAATALGACIIEKHFIISHRHTSADCLFSLDRVEFKAMVNAARNTWYALQPSEPKSEESSRVLRRSLYVVKDVKRGELFTRENVRSIRPGLGLPPKEIDRIIGRTSSRDISRGEPMVEGMIS